jgi:hypothetical protein
MKIYAIVDKSGKVIGTLNPGPVKLKDGTEASVGIKAREGQAVHELEVEDDVMKLRVEQVHAEVEKLIRSKASKPV